MKRVSGLVVLVWSASASAQVAPSAPESVPVGEWKLAPVVELRVRGEGRHDLDAQDHGTLTTRARLGADAERGPIELRVVLQDARVWDLGAGSGAFGQPGALAQTGAYEAWLEAHTAEAHPSFARLGRQAITWGEGRLLGASDWSPTGRTLDAARGRLVAGDWAFEALGASLSDPVSAAGSPVPSAYGELLGARVEWALDPLLAAEVYGLGRFAQANPVSDLEGSVKGNTYTAALALHGDARGWRWGVEGAAQVGHADALALDRLAWATSGHLGYLLEQTLLRPRLTVGGSYASGSAGGSRYGTFDPLLPDAHVGYGAMDLFSWSNIIEGHARVAVEPFADATAAVEYRYARQAQAGGAWRSDYLITLAPPSASTQAELGHEMDATLRWSPWVPMELAVGYSALVLGDGAKALLAGERVSPPDVAHYGFGQVAVRLP